MIHKSPIYLDYAATTPVDERVIQKMNQCLAREGIFGNPSSAHSFGTQAKEWVERARNQVAELLQGVSRNFIFTSGATEANNLAIKGVANFYRERGRHIITGKTEHKSVLEPCAYLEQEGFSVTYLNTDQHGLIDIDEFTAALKADTTLVSIMHVNNETGVTQNIEAIGKITRKRGIFFHVDATQSIGKIPIDLQKLSVDLLSFSAHKFYGPKGIGALYVNDMPRVRLIPQLQGGAQERKLRAGTLPTHQIVGLGEACQMVKEMLPVETAKIRLLRDRFWQGICDLPQVTLNSPEEVAVPHILNVCFGAMQNEILLDRLKNIAATYASACNTIQLEPSHVLKAMGMSDLTASRSIRFSFGRFSTKEEIDEAIDIIRTQYLRGEH